MGNCFWEKNSKEVIYLCHHANKALIRNIWLEPSKIKLQLEIYWVSTRHANNLKNSQKWNRNNLQAHSSCIFPLVWSPLHSSLLQWKLLLPCAMLCPNSCGRSVFVYRALWPFVFMSRPLWLLCVCISVLVFNWVCDVLWHLWPVWLLVFWIQCVLEPFNPFNEGFMPFAKLLRPSVQLDFSLAI